MIRFRVPAETIPEQSPVGSSGSNGVVERGIQAVERMSRVLKLCLEDKWSAKIPDDHAIITWMVGHAGYLLSRFSVGVDGKTPYERLKGKKAKMGGVEFGEGIWFKMKSKSQGIGKLATAWRDGVYLGIRTLSGEIIVGTEEGVWKARTIRRKPFESRWCSVNSKMIGGVPWKVSPEDEGDGLPMPGRIEIDSRVMEEEEKEKIQTEPLAPATFRITKDDRIKHGFTEGCRGCTAVLKGAQRRMHTEACRRRLGKEMKDEGKVQKASKREVEFIVELSAQEEAKKKRRLEKDMASSSASPAEEEKEEKEEPRGEKRRGGDRGGDVDYDEEGSRINRVEKQLFEINVEEVDEEMLREALDDVTGEGLDPKVVAASRKEEIDFMIKKGIWEVVDIEDCWASTGKAPTSVKWVDTKKRSRLVGRDFKPKGEDIRADIFASMPPWEAKEILFSSAVSQKGQKEVKKLLFVDATKAHINGVCDVDAFVDLPEEIGEEGKCGKLKFWLYGMRPAARAWEELYAGKLKEAGFAMSCAAAQEGIVTSTSEICTMAVRFCTSIPLHR